MRRGGDAWHVTDQRTIGTPEVRLLSSKNHILSLCAKIGGAKNHVRNMQLHTHIPGGHPQDGRASLLGWGSIPSELIEDTLAITATMDVAATKPGGTCETPG
jgi:hypothetical protein